MNIKTYSRGEIIFREGDAGDCVYELSYGSVGIYVNYGKENEQKISELMGEQFFGEMGLILEEPRETTAVATSDEAYVEVIYLKDLEAVFSACPVKIDMLLKHLSFRLRRLTIDFLDICKDITSNYS